MATESCTTVRRSSSLPKPLISKLVDDLLTEILIRLPHPTSACRSKAVCKHWRCLISDPCFSSRFLSHHQGKGKSKNNQPPPEPELLLSADSLLSFLPMPAYYYRDGEWEKFAIFDCFKDLLLCGFGEHGYGYSNLELARSYLLCNSFTKQWIALPLAPETRVGISWLSARLVCSISNNGSNGFDHVNRFRVVCIYQDGDADSMKLDVFCSESGEWTKEALVLQGYRIHEKQDVVSCNGILYVPCRKPAGDRHGSYISLIAGLDPFRLDVPHISIDIYSVCLNQLWNISISQGALHLAVQEFRPTGGGSVIIAWSVWRLNEEDGGMSWTKVCESGVESSRYPLFYCRVPTLHPEQPEIAFFTCCSEYCHVSCDLGEGKEVGELEIVAKQTQFFKGWRVFQPRLSCCWPTQIPRYQKLRGVYDGSYSCWVQTHQPRTPSITEQRHVDGVEQFSQEVESGARPSSSAIRKWRTIGGGYYRV